MWNKKEMEQPLQALWTHVARCPLHQKNASLYALLFQSSKIFLNVLFMCDFFHSFYYKACPPLHLFEERFLLLFGTYTLKWSVRIHPYHIINQEHKNIWGRMIYLTNSWTESLLVKDMFVTHIIYNLICLLGPRPIKYGGLSLHHIICICWMLTLSNA